MVCPRSRHFKLGPLAVAVLAAVGGIGSQAIAGAQPAPMPNAGVVLSLINQQRTQNGCGPVSLNPQLATAATRHARDMMSSGVTGHSGSDGSSPERRISDAGYSPIGKWGEIVYVGWGSGGTPQAAVDWWMNSPTHRAVIVDCAFKDIGVSVVSVNGQMASAADFGTH
jgi:uncharacterized protein YkwD